MLNVIDCFKGLFKKNKNCYIEGGDDFQAERSYIEREWKENGKSISYGELLKRHCYESVGKCRGCTNYKCSINGGK